MKKEVKLYNVIFPIFMLYVFPTYAWLFIILLNFIIDSLVVILAAKSRKLDWKNVWKKSILNVVWIGFLCDFVGGALTWVLAATVFEGLNLFTWPDLIFLTLPGIALAGVLIYFVNKKFSFRKAKLEPEQVHHICLMLAIFTAPYTMMIPYYLH